MKRGNYGNAARRRGIRTALILMLAVIITNLIIPLSLLLAKSVDFQPFWAGFAKVLSAKTSKTALIN